MTSMGVIGGLTLLEVMLYPVAIGTWSYVVYVMLQLSRELWGTDYTSVVPQFLGADALILLITVLQPATLLMGSALGVQATYSYALAAMQILAGILFMQGMHDVYQIEWATKGFDAVEVATDG